MATKVCPALNCGALPAPKSLPVASQPIYHQAFSHTTHSSLQVCDDTPGSPQPDNIDVTVFDPSKNLRIPFNLKSTDTTDILTQKYLQVRPELGKNVHLVFNGKPVPAQMYLRDLGVKPGAMFITFQKCIGG